MPYSFTQTPDPLAIAEQRYATSNEVRFTNFDSCIGLLGRNGNTVTGVHLVVLGFENHQDIPFDDGTIDRALEALGTYTQVAVIGQLGAWHAHLGDVYLRLIQRLRNPHTYEVNNGTYGGRVHNGVFQTRRDDETYVNV